MKFRVTICLCVGLLVAMPGLAQGQTAMSVQVQNGQLRSSPSFLGQVVAPVKYGDAVQVVQQQGDWVKVTAPSGQSGWIHKSALTKKRIVMNAGSQNVQTAASGQELALAGKGFNSDIEAEFKNKNRNMDYTWVDRMVTFKVSSREIKTFLDEGGVKQGRMP